MITAVLILSITLYSCSTDSTEAPQENALEKELNLENDSYLQLGSETFIFKSTGETAKYVDDNKAFDFIFDNEQIFTAQKIEEKHGNETILITNSVTGETVKLLHYEELKNGVLKFDVETSSGLKFNSMIYTPRAGYSNAQRWHEEPPAFSKNVLKTTLQLAQQSQNSSCQNAIDNCTTSGGTATVTLNNQHGWFTTPASCQVVCNQ